MFKMIRDTWIYLRDIGIQCFLNFGDICHIYFRDMGYVFKIIKEIWNTGTPFHGLTAFHHGRLRLLRLQKSKDS